MPERAADDFQTIARNLRHMQDLKKEAQDKANAEEALEQQMQRADEPAASALVRAHNPLGFRDHPTDDAWVNIVEGLG